MKPNYNSAFKKIVLINLIFMLNNQTRLKKGTRLKRRRLKFWGNGVREIGFGFQCENE